MRRKLQSGRGASITFALLIFLVCAVVGAVVLAAATAAAGRMAGLAEADQRYYSVTSAARLFQEQFDGTKVTVERVQFERYQRKTTITNGVRGTTVSEPATGTPTYSGTLKRGTNTYSSENNTLSGSGMNNLLEYLAYCYTFGENATGAGTPDLAEAFARQNTGSAETIECTVSVEGKPGLSVIVNAAIKANGNVELDFVNANNSKGEAAQAGQQFKVHMVLSANVESQNAELHEERVSDESSQNLEILNCTDTRTRTDTITWTVHSIEVG